MTTGASVTPVILTFNEAANIRRTLEALTWADEVVIVDSGSTDGTEAAARQFPNVRWIVRPFDSHGAQWRFAFAADIRSPYILALDADYVVPPAFVQELTDRFLPGGFAGGIAGFEYVLNGHRLLGSVYPAKVVIFRRGEVEVTQPGHSQELRVSGATYRFASRLVHDDRKPVARFMSSQMSYARLEDERLTQQTTGRWQDRVRRAGLMPLLAGIGSYVKAGGPLKGTASLRYAYERMLFECMLALRILGRGHAADEGAPQQCTPPHTVARPGTADGGGPRVEFPGQPPK